MFWCYCCCFCCCYFGSFFYLFFRCSFIFFYVVVIVVVAVVIVRFLWLFLLEFVCFSCICVCFFASCRFNDAPLHMTMCCFYSKCSSSSTRIRRCSNESYICCFASNPCRWFTPYTVNILLQPSSSSNSNHVSYDYSNLVVVMVVTMHIHVTHVTFSLSHARTHSLFICERKHQINA